MKVNLESFTKTAKGFEKKTLIKTKRVLEGKHVLKIALVDRTFMIA